MHIIQNKGLLEQSFHIMDCSNAYILLLKIYIYKKKSI